MSSISQRFPFTGGLQPVGGEEIFEREPDTIAKGKWYVEDVEMATGGRFDHFDPVVGAKIKGAEMEAAQLRLYGELNALLKSL